LTAKKIKVHDKFVDAYYFCVGGALGLHQAVARPVGYRCLATEVPDAIERLLRGYLADRESGENLRKFLARQSDAELRELLAGTVLDAVARDAAPPKAREGGHRVHAAGGDGD
jgi:sulfite reductase (ferredoxin)